MDILYFLFGFIIGAVFIWLLKRGEFCEGGDIADSLLYEYDTPEEERENMKDCVIITLAVVASFLILWGVGILV